MSELAPATPPPARSKQWVVPLLVGVNLVAMLGLGGYVVFTQRNVAHAREAAHAEPEHGPAHFGPIVDVETMLTNLNDPSAEHYIKVTVRLEVANEAAVAQVTSGIVPVRDRYLAYLSGLTVADTLGPEKQGAIRRTMKSLANEVLGQPIVRHVYIAEFVIQ